MINKFEAVGIFVCVGIMAIALFLMRVDSNALLLSGIEGDTQAAAVVVSNEEGNGALIDTLADSITPTGEIDKLIIDDVIEGEGAEVQSGDTVSVHYIGTLQNGQQFDNSYTKGSPFTFSVGKGEVIQGWEQGLIGMKEGGQRILVIPASLAYGNKAVGLIPPHATLVFSVELVEIK